jgi:outer membrane protein assembly factor BamB
LKKLAEDALTEPADAASRFDSLLQAHPDGLTRADSGGLISVGAWLDASLTDAQRQSLAVAYSQTMDAPAKAAFDTLRKSVRPTPEDFYALARRYPLSSIAGRAYAAAADLAVRLGDAPAAVTYYELAVKSGNTLDPAQFQSADSSRKFAAEEGRAQAAFRGPLPTDTTWYARAESVSAAKCIPRAADGIICFAGPRHVLAVKETGQTIWKWTSPEVVPNAAAYTPDRRPGQGRGPVFAPTLFCNATGAQILVVRQPRGMSRDFCLRAFRATDGKPLWSTDSIPAYDSISFAGNPLICGRYVYAVAVEFTEDSANLLLTATSLLDGELIFKSSLGQLPGLRRGRAEIPGSWDDLWNQSEPGVSGDLIFLTPNVGYAFALGRFDGKIRWVAPYDTAADGDPAPRRNLRRDILNPADPAGRRRPPTDPEQLVRYRNTPVVADTGTLVIAPQDSSGASALDTRTGKTLWTLEQPPAPTLIGGSLSADNLPLALFAGQHIQAITARTGRAAWRWSPPAALKISGPPALAAGLLYVPTGDGKTVCLNSSTGQSVDATTRPIPLRQILSNTTLRRELDDAMILRTFAPAPPPPAQTAPRE